VRTCLLFSGQSAQKKGMCAQLWKNAVARELLRRLNPSMGIDLEFVTTRMEDAVLQQTFNAQRGIHAHHLGNWFAFLAAHPLTEVDAVIGHSMGVFAALVVAGSITVEDSARLIFERARIFSETCKQLGGEDWGLMACQMDNLKDLLEELHRVPGLELALHNSQGKGVIGGRLSDLNSLAEISKNEEWPVEFRLLKVEGPYHTSAFASCKVPWKEVLSSVQIEPPKIPIFMGTSGKREEDPERIRELLALQPFSTELFYQAVSQALEGGFRRFLEVANAPQAIQLISEIGNGEYELRIRKISTSEIIDDHTVGLIRKAG
jgi:[acyl-carrier-protein] S-malonyltransferase